MLPAKGLVDSQTLSLTCRSTHTDARIQCMLPAKGLVSGLLLLPIVLGIMMSLVSLQQMVDPSVLSKRPHGLISSIHMFPVL